MDVTNNVSNGLWALSSNGELIDPNDYPYLIDWVNTAKQWVETYRIREFISADDDGFDPSGRVTEDSEWTTDESSESPIPASRVWSSTGLAEYRISSELSVGENFGDHVVFGWYVGELAHNQDNESIPSLMHVCSICRGSGYVFIPNDFNMDDINSSDMFEIIEEEDGLHLRPLHVTQSHTSIEEIEYPCRDNICGDSWIYLEDTGLKLDSDNFS